MKLENKQFMLTFSGAHANWNKKTELEWKELNKQHAAWMEKFKSGFKSAAKLASAPSRLLKGDKDRPSVTDGPFAETREALTGFYVIEAKDINQAVDLAKGCPWLLHDTMEIFEVES